MRIFLLSILFFISTNMLAFENKAVVDSVSPTLKAKFALSMDTKATWIGGFPTPMFGLKTGVELYPYRFGLGYCGLLRTMKVPLTLDKNTIDSDIKFDYWNLWFDRLWFRDKRWEVKTAFQAGFATIDITEPSQQSDLLQLTQQHQAGLIEISQDFHYKLCDWLAVGAAGGYRFMLSNESIINNHFQAPMYAVRLKIFPIELAHLLVKKR